MNRISQIALFVLATCVLLGQDASGPQTPEAVLQIEALLLETGLNRPPDPPPGEGQDAASAGSVDFRIQWKSLGQAGGGEQDKVSQTRANAGRFSIASRAAKASPVVRQKNPEFHPSMLLAVAVGENNEMLAWTLVHDPRILRAEFPTDSGELRGQVFMREEAELLVAFPDDARIREVRIFQRVWPEVQLRIQELGRIALTGEAR